MSSRWLRPSVSPREPSISRSYSLSSTGAGGGAGKTVSFRPSSKTISRLGLRERFTSPEIQRTNLAAVILQLLALDLGPIDEFPFLDPPRAEAIRDGHKTLFELSAIEMERPGPSYTVDSMEELQRLYGESASLFLVMAVDSLAQIDTWREPERILAMAEWAVGPRPGSPTPTAEWLDERFGKDARRIHLLEGPGLAVSATQIRERVAAGRAIRYLVPRAVEELILDQGLYRRRS